MLELYDNLPVLTLPCGRRALTDTGLYGVHALSPADPTPVEIEGRRIHPTVAPIDLAGIAQRIGAPTLDLLIGVGALRDGFTIDLEGGQFELDVRDEGPRDELVGSLELVPNESGGLSSPTVEVRIGDARATGIFDTGAAYSLWRHRDGSDRAEARVVRSDFHVAEGGRLVDFDVWMRPERVEIGPGSIELDLAYLPASWPAGYPELVLGMDVPAALGSRWFVLDPRAGQLRFYR